MRILVVQNLYAPHAYGGYEDLCAGAVAHWHRAGHEVMVIASDWHRPDVAREAPEPHGERVERILPFYWADHQVRRPTFASCLAMERTSRRHMGATLDEFSPDVVSVWNAAGLSFGLFDEITRRRVPSVLVLGDRWLDFGPAMDGWLGRFLGGIGGAVAPLVAAVTGLPTRVSRLGDPVVACFASAYLQDHAHRTADWVLDDEVVVPHGLDLGRYPVVAHRDAPRTWRGRLLYVGRVAATKGVETAVRAVAQVPNVTLDVVGPAEPGYAEHLATVVDELGVGARVNLHGEAGAEQLRSAYATADALVFPSQWQEPFGIVALEAMAQGLPVIGSGTGGSSEFLVDGVTALRFVPADVDDLARVITRMADDGELRARLRSAGHRVAAWLDRRRTYDELLGWHTWAAGRLQGPRPCPRNVLPEDVDAEGSEP